MRRQDSGRIRFFTVLEILGVCVIGGIIFAVLPVILEYAGLSFRGIPASPEIFMNAAILPYLIISGLGGLLLGTLLSALYSLRVFSGTGEATVSIVLSIMVAGWLFFVVAGVINILYLPLIESVRSIVSNLGLIAVFLALGYGLYRFFGFLSSRFSQWALFGGMAFVILAAGAVFYFSPSLTSSSGVSFKRERTTGPSVVLVVADAIRADHLSCFGYHRKTSPFLDELAGRGTLFTNFVSTSSWTRPSVASLFTSLYPSGHNTITASSRVPSKIETLPEIMKRNGYVTGLFTNTGQVGTIFGFGQGVDHYFMSRRRTMINYTALAHATMKFLPGLEKRFKKIDTMERGEKNLPVDALLMKRFLSWRDSLGKKPYFAYLHFMAPHTSYNPPPPYFDKFLTTPPDKIYEAGSFHDNIGLGVTECDKELPDSTERTLIELYDGEIAFIDNLLSSLVEALYSENSSEVILIITADHGEGFYEHCKYEHGQSLYHEKIWVPTIIYYPGVVPRGLRVSRPASTVDIAPTILSLAGLPPQKSFMGEDLKPILHNEKDKVTPYAYSELLGDENVRSIFEISGYKLIKMELNDKDVYELYDLNSDPGEKKNLYADEKYEKVRERLVKKMSEMKEYASLPQFEEVEVELDPETKRRLKALGYIQ